MSLKLEWQNARIMTCESMLVKPAGNIAKLIML